MGLGSGMGWGARGRWGGGGAAISDVGWWMHFCIPPPAYHFPAHSSRPHTDGDRQSCKTGTTCLWLLVYVFAKMGRLGGLRHEASLVQGRVGSREKSRRLQAGAGRRRQAGNGAEAPTGGRRRQQAE